MKQKFHRDLKLGNDAEKKLGELLEKSEFKTQYKNLPEYDLVCEGNGVSFTVEVKFDKMASETGNVAVEFYNTKKCEPSGITKTTADLWCFVFEKPSEIWLTATKRLREFLICKTPFRSIFGAGDNNAALKLYRIEEILPKIFHRVDILSADELRLIVRGLLCTSKSP